MRSALRRAALRLAPSPMAESCQEPLRMPLDLPVNAAIPTSFSYRARWPRSDVWFRRAVAPSPYIHGRTGVLVVAVVSAPATDFAQRSKLRSAGRHAGPLRG